MGLTERRTIERFRMRLPATVSCAVTGESRRMTTRDISSDGVFLVTDKPLGQGAKVNLTLELFPADPSDATKKQHSQVNLSGRVLRRETSGMVVAIQHRTSINRA